MTKAGHSVEYERRLRSPDWAASRCDRIIKRRWRCEGCGDLAYDLELHHRHYNSIGGESPDDVEPRCRVCHRRADAERRRRVEAARWDARMDGWASRVYCDDWHSMYERERVEEDFQDWLALGGEG